MPLDINFVRQQFPQLADSGNPVFCSNAGGSFVAQPVLDLFEQYNRHTRVQPYSNFSPSKEAGEAMDRAKHGWAEALNIGQDELTFGPSTSINSYVMAQAISTHWNDQDEVIVCQQDHEANHGVWRRQAEQLGVTVKEWQVNAETGLLDPDELYDLLTESTRWVFFTHCSNLIGTVNPVAEIVEGIRRRSAAKVCVDGVAYAPHHIPDLKHLDVDMYLFSLYKVFGPHQGLLYVKGAIQEQLAPQSHYFLTEEPTKRFNPAGPQHAEVAAAAGVLDYFSLLAEHHNVDGDLQLCERLQQLHNLLAEHERNLASPLLDYLSQSSKVRLLGKVHCQDHDRAATIAFKPLEQSAAQTAAQLQAAGIGTESGHFYAQRVLRGVGIDPADGIVRLSLVHYNSFAEVQQILQALDSTLN